MRQVTSFKWKVKICPINNGLVVHTKGWFQKFFFVLPQGNQCVKLRKIRIGTVIYMTLHAQELMPVEHVNGCP